MEAQENYAYQRCNYWGGLSRFWLGIFNELVYYAEDEAFKLQPIMDNYAQYDGLLPGLAESTIPASWNTVKPLRKSEAKGSTLSWVNFPFGPQKDHRTLRCHRTFCLLD